MSGDKNKKRKGTYERKARQVKRTPVKMAATGQRKEHHPLHLPPSVKWIVGWLLKACRALNQI